GKGVTAGQQPEAGSAAEVEVEAARRSNTAGDDARGDVSVHGLWKHGSTCILDIRITDTDSKSYEASSSSKVLEKAAKTKKDKYAEACLERRRSFTPLVYSVDGMACKEAKAFEKRIASLLASKHDRPYSEMVGFVRSRMSLAIIRSNTLLLRGARQGSANRPEIDGSASFTAMERYSEW
ncbi:hypothetical protein ACHAXR_000265, partial [Thalassiosira sp. AJA248-18]